MGIQRGIPIKTGDVTIPTGCRAHAADECLGALSVKAPMDAMRKCWVYLPSSCRGRLHYGGCTGNTSMRGAGASSGTRPGWPHIGKYGATSRF